MNATSSFLCLIILLLFCLSYQYSLHGDKNEVSRVDAMKKVQGGRRSREEFRKETKKMKKKKPAKKEKSVEEEDSLVAYTADYWKPRRHPPKNN